MCDLYLTESYSFRLNLETDQSWNEKKNLQREKNILLVRQCEEKILACTESSNPSSPQKSNGPPLMCVVQKLKLK